MQTKWLVSIIVLTIAVVIILWICLSQGPTPRDPVEAFFRPLCNRWHPEAPDEYVSLGSQLDPGRSIFIKLYRYGNKVDMGLFLKAGSKISHVIHLGVPFPIPTDTKQLYFSFEDGSFGLQYDEKLTAWRFKTTILANIDFIAYESRGHCVVGENGYTVLAGHKTHKNNVMGKVDCELASYVSPGMVVEGAINDVQFINETGFAYRAWGKGRAVTKSLLSSERTEYVAPSSWERYYISLKNKIGIMANLVDNDGFVVYQSANGARIYGPADLEAEEDGVVIRTKTSEIWISDIHMSSTLEGGIGFGTVEVKYDGKVVGGTVIFETK